MAKAQAGEFVVPGQGVAAGCVPIEWVGEKSPTDDPRVQYALLTGQLTPQQRRILDAAIEMTIRRVDGKRSRTIAPCDALPVLSRPYTWGPRMGTYVVAVLFRDADMILACASGHEFRDATGGAPVGALNAPKPEPIKIVDRQSWKSIEAYRRDTD